MEECNSLTKLGLTSSYYAGYENNPYNATVGYRFMNDSREMPVNWEECLSFGLASTTSLKELTVTVSDYEYLNSENWVWFLKIWLEENKSLTTLTLTVNDYSECEEHDDWLHLMGRDDFAENSSLTKLNLTVNVRCEVSIYWLPCFCDYLMMNCSSLRTVRLQVNNCCTSSESRLYDLSGLRLKYRSLSTFELSVTFYGE